MEKVDKRFALIATNDDVLYPCMKVQKITGREGFALTRPGEGDRNGEGTYTTDIGEVVRRLVFDGWKVRATTLDGERHGSYGIGKKAIKAYWVDDELLPLVENAPRKPDARRP